MADISIIHNGSTDYNVKDAAGREALAVVENKGAKNILNQDGFIVNSSGGLTLTDTGNGTYKITGTPSGTVDVFTTPSGNYNQMYGLETGKTYTISGLPTGNGLLCRIDVSKNNSGSWDAQIINNLTLPQTFTIPSDATGLYIRYRITTSATIPSGGITLAPMICTKAEWDISQAYVPYCKTNAELTVENDSQQSEIDYAVNTGAKNLLKIDKSQIKSSSWNTDWTWSGDTASNGNASITINQDNTFTVTVSNTMASQVIFDIHLSNDGVSNAILSGCPSGGSSSTHFMYVKGTSYYDTGNGVTFSKTGPFRIAIVVASGHAAGTYVFKPMIRSASISDTSYQPYARSNSALTAEMDVVANAGAKNIAPVNSGSGTSVNLFNRSCFVSAGQYILSYKASDFSGNYELAFYDAAGTYIPGGLNGSITANKSVEFRLRADAYRMRFSILGTATITELMLRPAAITDPTFQPYARTNRELTVLTDEDRASLVELVDNGAKNLLKITESSSGGDVNFTVNGDGTITVDGTAGTSNVVFIVARGLTIPAGNYYISMFDNSQYYSDKMYISAQFKNYPSGSSTWTGHEYYTDTQINPAGDIQAVAIVVKAGQTVSQTVKPMICTTADYAVSTKFVPYTLSNAELTAEVKNITPTIIKDQSTSVGTSYTLISSLTQTTTAGKLCKISAIIAYRNYRPRGIVLSYSNDSSNFDTGDKLIAKTENTEATYELSASAIISRNNVPVYVWAKAATAGAERIYSIMEQLGDL